MNDQGEVLVVKEVGRTWWDLPGGGMDHGEDIKSALARELKEEVNLSSNFTYRVIDVEDPAYLSHANSK
jgi:8-oxo-dGTP pyrophosphatase MutT (NUDIX family)